jgi:hypothetical protein
MPSGVGARRAKVLPLSRDVEEKEIPDLHERIALRAYEIFDSRGRTHGHDWDDWLRAEQEILSEQMDTDLG